MTPNWTMVMPTVMTPNWAMVMSTVMTPNWAMVMSCNTFPLQIPLVSMWDQLSKNEHYIRFPDEYSVWLAVKTSQGRNKCPFALQSDIRTRPCELAHQQTDHPCTKQCVTYRWGPQSIATTHNEANLGPEKYPMHGRCTYYNNLSAGFPVLVQTKSKSCQASLPKHPQHPREDTVKSKCPRRKASETFRGGAS
jgi:hypothetical protein